MFQFPDRPETEVVGVDVVMHQQLDEANASAKNYQPVLGSLRSKLLFCTLLRLISRYQKNLRVFA